jgi:hypothetical protein
MPLPLPNAPSPRPPDVHVNPSVSELVAAVQTISRYQQAQAVWLQQQFAAVRATANWLVAQQANRNLVPDSDVKDPVTYWTVGAGWAITEGVGVGGGRGFTLTGATVTADVTSTAFVVIEANQYVLSGWLDARNLQSGQLSWLVVDASSGATIAEAVYLRDAAGAGLNGRTQALVQVPTGTLLVKVVLRAVAVTTAPEGIIGSEPQVELPVAGLFPGVTTPEATLYRTNVGDH